MEDADRERYKLQFKIEQIEKQLGTGICPACGQPVSVHNEAELKAELEQLQQELSASPAKSIDDARRQRDRLRPFAPSSQRLAASLSSRSKTLAARNCGWTRTAAHAADLRADQSNTVNIDTLERTLVDLKATKQRSSLCAGWVWRTSARRLRTRSIGSGTRLLTSPR